MTNQENKPVVWESNPAKRLENGFRRIARERMKGMPFCNKHLSVQAVGFRKWKYFWFGVMITPWTINLILSPGQKDKWKSVPQGRKLHYRFEAGLYDFISVHDDILGEYQMCSMISPPTEFEFPCQSFAVEVARAILDEIQKPEQPPELGEEMKPLGPQGVPITERIENAMEKEVSRRSLISEPANVVKTAAAEETA